MLPWRLATTGFFIFVYLVNVFLSLYPRTRPLTDP